MKRKTLIAVSFSIVVLLLAIFVVRNHIDKVMEDELKQQYSIPASGVLTKQQINTLKERLRQEILLGHVEMVQKIIELVPLDAAIDAGLLFDGVVAEHCSGEIVEMLLNKGLYDVTQRDGNGETMLHAAAFHGHHEAAELLIKNGADVNAKGIDREAGPSFQQTPLHICAQYGTWKVAKVLLENGANIDDRDRSGYRPLDIALKSADPDHESACGKRKVAKLIRKYSQERQNNEMK